MASEQFSLCWDNFHKNMSSGMNSLLESEDLVDVTLAVDGRYLKAHKMVLSVCSPYFKELFKVNPCKHPIVFMKDVSYTAMSDLLQFMYQGEVQVSQENLTTFIKTAEALQIKGLTGDGNGSTECDNQDEPKQQDSEFSTKTEFSAKTVPSRPKKTYSMPQQTPPPKRQRVSAPEPAPSQSTKTETASVSGTSSNDQLIQFKMEPYDQSQSSVTIPDENPDEIIGGDPLDDTAFDDNNEDYSMMEGGDEEPQAGTSADGTAGEGQELSKVRKLQGSIIVNGFTYHHNTIKKKCNMRYLVCAEYRRLSCKARAQIPIGSSRIEDLILRKEHNHPPWVGAGCRHDFIQVLKAHIRSQPTVPLKEIYDRVSILNPDGGELCPFKKMASSMRRWRMRAIEQSNFGSESEQIIMYSVE